MDSIVLKKTKKFTSDIYFMEAVADKIIVNDNYRGVMILDYDLKVEQQLTLTDNLVIDMSFIKKNEIVLVCYDNQCLIHINIHLLHYRIIPMDEKLQEKSFLQLFEWKDNELTLLADEGEEIVYINLYDGSLRTVQRETTDEDLPAVCYDWDNIKAFTMHKAYPGRGEAIVEADHLIKRMRYREGAESILEVDPFETEPWFFYDIELMRDVCLQVGEKAVLLSKGKDRHHFITKGKNERFVRGRFVLENDKISFMLLSGNESDGMQSIIEKYELESE